LFDHAALTFTQRCEEHRTVLEQLCTKTASCLGSRTSTPKRSTSSSRPHDKALGELTGARRKALANKDQSRSAAMHAALAECSTTQQHLAQATQSLKASTEWKQLRIQYRK
jgi:hypothetical protein